MKQSYTMPTPTGFKKLDVEGDEDALDQLQAVLVSIGKLRDLYSTLFEIEHQAVQTREWLEAAIDKSQLKPLFNEETL